MVEEKKCCGCMACVNVCNHKAVTIRKDNRGFYQPVIRTELCKDCGLCSKVCPIAQSANTVAKEDKKVYAVQCISRIKRAQSQSGGAFTIMAEYILSKHGVVYGVAQSDDLQVVYERIETISQLHRLKGSKYVQAISRKEFFLVEKDLNNGKWVLFSGTPCFVAGLLWYLYTKKCDMSRLLGCDIVCHGVSSPGIYEEYIEDLKCRQGKNVTKFVFRDKRFGWRRNISSYLLGNKTMITSDYIKIFESQYCLREICYCCPYASTNRVGDITIGDYWGIEKVYPKLDDDTGVSLLLINTAKGNEVFEQIKKNLIVVETQIKDCLQPNLQYPTLRPESYTEFWDDYWNNGFKNTMRDYCDLNKEQDWEYIEKSQYFRRIRNKIRRILAIGEKKLGEGRNSDFS